MNPPQPNGLHGSYCLTSTECLAMKMDGAVADLKVEEWTNASTLADSFVAYHGCAVEDSNKALQKIINSFNILSKKRSRFVALVTFCLEVVKFISRKSTRNKFKVAFDEAFIKRRISDNERLAQLIGYSNAVELTVNGGREYHKKMTEGRSDAQPCEPQDKGKDSLGKRERDAFITKDNTTAGTTIKQRGIELHESFIANKGISTPERKIMTSGLSSILDLIDLTDDGQSSLFDLDDWTRLQKEFMLLYKADQFHLSPLIQDTWDMIVALCKRDNGFESAQLYLTKLNSKSTISNTNKRILRVLRVAIDSLESNMPSIEKGLLPSYTENDFLLKIWGPLLDAILFVNNNLIRMKTGESVNGTSSESKKQQYPQHTNVSGFKIDLRFVYDSKDKQEFDVGAGESARSSQDDKLAHDLGKLTREGKDVLDGLVCVALDDEQGVDCSGWVLQLSGMQGQIASVHLAGDGLYVAVPQGKLLFPMSISSMGPFLDTLQVLFLFVAKMESNAHLIKDNIESIESRRVSMGKTFNRPRPPKPGNSKLSWQRPTWYTPPRNEPKLSCLPYDLFGKVVANNDLPVSSSQSTSTGIEYDGNPDEFGFVRLTDGRLYNHLQKKIVDRHPLNDE
ncbi:hypothetical protein BCR42DRAFT_356875 [Absidia repens]|uniref:Uncharacterized protein n=1 Tax=Absidia repens TaxID=90262 RepID=A0A1X2I9A4_9FUNG|nr:hypothetical protein BCR42DRAFT_356875 [Absidia repens]